MIRTSHPLLKFFLIAGVFYVGTLSVKYMEMPLNLLPKEPILISLKHSELKKIEEEHQGNSSNLAIAINALIDNEILYREAIKLGLALNDAIVIDRMVKNIEYVAEPSRVEQGLELVDLTQVLDKEVEIELFKSDPIIRRRLIELAKLHFRQSMIIAHPADAELQAYMRNHPDSFSVPKRISFSQIYIDPKRVEGDIGVFLSEIEKKLKGESPSNEGFGNGLGHASILPTSQIFASNHQIGQQFGRVFSQAVNSAPLDTWVGPVNGALGVHFIKVTQVRESALTDLKSSYNRAFLGWLENKKRQVLNEQLDELRHGYLVIGGDINSPMSVSEFAQYWLEKQNNRTSERKLTFNSVSSLVTEPLLK